MEISIRSSISVEKLAFTFCRRNGNAKLIVTILSLLRTQNRICFAIKREIPSTNDFLHFTAARTQYEIRMALHTHFCTHFALLSRDAHIAAKALPSGSAAEAGVKSLLTTCKEDGATACTLQKMNFTFSDK